MTPSRLFHYQTFKDEHFVSLLSERKLKLSRANQFNDPWDCRVHYRAPTDPVEIGRAIQYWKELNRKHHPEIGETKRALIAHHMKSHPDELMEAFIKTDGMLYDRICTQYRIYCLSEKHDVPLMWSHYASAHTGICLEFDTKCAPFSCAIKVRYLSAYPAHDIAEAADDDSASRIPDSSFCALLDYLLRKQTGTG